MATMGWLFATGPSWLFPILPLHEVQQVPGTQWHMVAWGHNDWDLLVPMLLLKSKARGPDN